MKHVFKLWAIKLHDKRTGGVTVETGYEPIIPLLFTTRKSANEFRGRYSSSTAKTIRVRVSVEEMTTQKMEAK